jgi:diguanylate cyclase (GGDEF)-like protein
MALGIAWDHTGRVIRLFPGRPRRLSYALVGVVLAIGAPCGLLLLRAVAGGAFSRAWLTAELRTDVLTYAYVAISTGVVFALFGFVVGRQADSLIELSATDGLTKLRNRRAVQERLRDEVARARRYDQPLSFLLIDLDRLKQINDSLGHRGGDAALKRVAAAIRRGSREADLAGRWGGDEFALVAPNTTAEAGSMLAERIRKLVAESAPVGFSPETISIGVATLTARGTANDPEQIVREADEALYRSKAGGRNRVTSA